MSPRRVEEIADPQGGRNHIRRGDVVEVRPGGGRAHWVATFQSATVKDGALIEIEVYGGPVGHFPETRIVLPGRVHRLAQTREGERRTRAGEERRRANKRIANRRPVEED